MRLSTALSRLVCALATALALATTYVPAAAQTPIAMLACTGLADGAERLACFDREAEALKGRIASGEVAIVERRQLEAGERANFGLPNATQAATILAPAAALGATAPDRARDAQPGGAQTQTAEAAPAPAVPAQPAAKSQPLQSIAAKVVEVIPSLADRFVLQLDDGSIWRTTEGSTTFYPRTGDMVTISRASLGSFMMKTDKSRLVRAKRMR
jgi:hypothetical protein